MCHLRSDKSIAGYKNSLECQARLNCEVQLFGAGLTSPNTMRICPDGVGNDVKKKGVNFTDSCTPNAITDWPIPRSMLNINEIERKCLQKWP